MLSTSIADVFSAKLAAAGTSGETKIFRVFVHGSSDVKVEVEHSLLSSPKTITCMEWLSSSQLVVARLGEVVIWTPEATRSFILPIQNYRGWPSVPTPVAITRLASPDRLLITLTDGTFRFILDFLGSTESSSSSNETHGTQLSNNVRRAFLAVEGTSSRTKNTSVSNSAAMMISGLIGLDNSGTSMWAYEKQNLDVKVYNMANLHKTTFLIGKLYSEELADQCLTDLQAVLLSSKPGTGVFIPSFPRC